MSHYTALLRSQHSYKAHGLDHLLDRLLVKSPYVPKVRYI